MYIIMLTVIKKSYEIKALLTIDGLITFVSSIYSLDVSPKPKQLLKIQIRSRLYTNDCLFFRVMKMKSESSHNLLISKLKIYDVIKKNDVAYMLLRITYSTQAQYNQENW